VKVNEFSHLFAVFQAFVFDFGSEMYVWTGKNVLLDVRRRVLKLAADQWQSGYDYSEFPVNPLCPLTRQFHFPTPFTLWFFPTNYSRVVY